MYYLMPISCSVFLRPWVRVISSCSQCGFATICVFRFVYLLACLFVSESLVWSVEGVQIAFAVFSFYFSFMFILHGVASLNICSFTHRFASRMRMACIDVTSRAYFVTSIHVLLCHYCMRAVRISQMRAVCAIKIEGVSFALCFSYVCISVW